jgi:hypothetical protein
VTRHVGHFLTASQDLEGSGEGGGEREGGGQAKEQAVLAVVHAINTTSTSRNIYNSMRRPGTGSLETLSAYPARIRLVTWQWASANDGARAQKSNTNASLEPLGFGGYFCGPKKKEHGTPTLAHNPSCWWWWWKFRKQAFCFNDQKDKKGLNRHIEAEGGKGISSRKNVAGVYLLIVEVNGLDLATGCRGMRHTGDKSGTTPGIDRVDLALGSRNEFL